MNIVTAIKTHFLNSVREDEKQIPTKKQLNVTIEKEIIDQVRYIASQYGVPIAPTAAHMLQVGIHSLSNALPDPEKREKISRHILDTHLLGIDENDSPSIITMGERGDTWKILEQSQYVLKSYARYCQAPKITMKTGDISHMKEAEKALLKSAVGFARLLYRLGQGIPAGQGSEER